MDRGCLGQIDNGLDMYLLRAANCHRTARIRTINYCMLTSSRPEVTTKLKSLAAFLRDFHYVALVWLSYRAALPRRAQCSDIGMSPMGVVIDQVMKRTMIGCGHRCKYNLNLKYRNCVRIYAFSCPLG